MFEAHDRSLVARVQNHPLDILFVRTNDVVEFVARRRGGRRASPGGDILAESGVDLPVLRELGYGRCRLAAAVPVGRPVPGLADLGGRPRRDVAPQHRRAGSSRARAIAVEVVPLSGAVEVAPRLGLADAIVDLVSTGSTLAMNGLRPIGDLLASEAVLVANPTASAAQRADELDAHRHDARLGDRRARPQVPDDERPGGDCLDRARGRCSRASSRRPSSRSPTRA